MISGNAEITLRKATEEDLDNIKIMADAHRRELGFVRRPALLEAIHRKEIIVAQNSRHLAGFVHYRHRRDEQTTLYDIVVAAEYRLIGIGKALVQTLVAEIQALGKQTLILKCPAELPANTFYTHLGFERWKEEPGKHRPLIVWRLSIPSQQ
ncbi:MAG: GNAT family N-acetyltransferase [Anaerolineae bacterium]|nr:GNAT family N-acetyltransferase [Anaerolineae bacterium]